MTLKLELFLGDDNTVDKRTAALDAMLDLAMGQFSLDGFDTCVDTCGYINKNGVHVGRWNVTVPMPAWCPICQEFLSKHSHG